MPFNYSNLDASAQRLIKRFGVTAHILPVSGNTTTDWGTEQTEGDPVPVQAMLTSFNSMERANTAIELGDLKALISTEGLSFAPSVESRLRIAGDEYGIVEVEQVAPNGTAIIYKARVRR